jgi:hypothetical protein
MVDLAEHDVCKSTRKNAERVENPVHIFLGSNRPTILCTLISMRLANLHKKWLSFDKTFPMSGNVSKALIDAKKLMEDISSLTYSPEHYDYITEVRMNMYMSISQLSATLCIIGDENDELKLVAQMAIQKEFLIIQQLLLRLKSGLMTANDMNGPTPVKVIFW